MRRSLLIANATFADETIPSLASPVSDAARLAKLLARPEVGGYEVELCCDSTSSNVRQIIQRFFDRAQHGDLLFVLISGHGLKDRWGKLHFATADTVLDALSATSLESRFVLERMDESAASQQILFLDACYSGAFQKGTVSKAAAAALSRDDFNGETETGKAVITATTGIQLAGEAPSGSDVQSYFTRHLFEGIANGLADRRQTGAITLADLFGHIKDGLRRDAPGQTPQPFYYGLNPSVVVAKNPVWQPPALQSDLVARTISSDRHVRGIAVEELLAIATARGSDTELARSALRRFLTDDSMHVRTLARQALAELAEPAPPPDPPEPEVKTVDEPQEPKDSGGTESVSPEGASIGADFGSDERIESSYPGRRQTDGPSQPTGFVSARNWLAGHLRLAALAAVGLLVTSTWQYIPSLRLPFSNDTDAVRDNQDNTSTMTSNSTIIAEPTFSPSVALTNSLSPTTILPALPTPMPTPTPTPTPTTVPEKKEAAAVRRDVPQDTVFDPTGVGAQIAGPFIIFFEWSRSTLTPESNSILDKVLQDLSGREIARIDLNAVYGTSGENGPALARKRGAAIKGYLTARGISGSVIRVRVADAARPSAETADGVRNVQERRVEVSVYGP